MSSAEEELEKLRKQRAELVEWLEAQRNYHHTRGLELSGGFGSQSESEHCGRASALKEVIKFIAKQGGE